MKHGATTPPQRLVLLGHPVAHSLSPLFQNAALERAGLPLRYEPLDIAPVELDRTLADLTTQRAAGNVTIPHKEQVARACVRLSVIAERTGAVNVFWTEDGVLVGDNTDVPAFHEAAVELLGEVPQNARVAILGAGGAAAAVLIALASWPGVSVRIWARTAERATALCARAPGVARPAATPLEAVREATLVVNATPVGLQDANALPLAVDALPPSAAVLDLVYRPGETAWVRAARAHGHPAADGLGMLIAQGALAFERWFGITPDRRVMWSAVGGSSH